jgi:CHASE2 domain-containing sensor protein
MRHYRNLILCKSLTVTALSLLLGWLFYVILDVNVLDNLSKQDKDSDVLNYYYNIENRKAGDESYSSFFDDDIVIFDIEGEKSRANIAEAIRRIEAARPKAVALDIIFPANAATDIAADRKMTEVFDSYDNIYTAVRIDGDKTERSFYAKGKYAREGLVNNNTSFCPYEIFNGDSIFYMGYAITGVRGKPNSSRIVNFFDKEFTVLKIGHAIKKEDVEGKTVLVGDLGDLRDVHDMPFRIGGQYRVEGTRLLACSLSTILHNSWVVICPKYISWMIATLLTFLFTFFTFWLEGKERLAEALRNVIIAGTRIIIIVLLLMGSFALFSTGHKIVSPVYSIVALSLTGVTADMLKVGSSLLKKIKTTIIK